MAERINGLLPFVIVLLGLVTTLSLAVGRLVSRERGRKSRLAAQSVGLAARLAGPQRNLRGAWLDVLAGDPEGGYVLTPRQQRQHARGFLYAAVRLRLHDLTRPLWYPLDWILSSGSRTNSLHAMAVGAHIIYIQWHDGLHTLLTEGWSWVGGCALAVGFGLRWLRKARGIELATPEAKE
ncbi:hypothetical protein BGK67_33605 [Streptomyces subrutilus]|uniref:Uncharacterized protein n=1 Tax=Streptomyces subrutilus TaxID=36818 RepID=A0A1E5P091_9ACTN|nr:hypothetical protein BGK67_33605 [Streptomyces subrutilus]